jgi:hypothetical protein
MIQIEKTSCQEKKVSQDKSLHAAACGLAIFSGGTLLGDLEF